MTSGGQVNGPCFDIGYSNGRICSVNAINGGNPNHSQHLVIIRCSIRYPVPSVFASHAAILSRFCLKNCNTSPFALGHFRDSDYWGPSYKYINIEEYLTARVPVLLRNHSNNCNHSSCRMVGFAKIVMAAKPPQRSIVILYCFSLHYFSTFLSDRMSIGFNSSQHCSSDVIGGKPQQQQQSSTMSDHELYRATFIKWKTLLNSNNLIA